MLKKIIPATIIFAALFFLLIPLTTYAALPCSGPIVSCGRDCAEWNETRSCCITPGPGVTLAQAQPCNLCHFIKILQCLISSFGTVIIVWAGIYVLIGGILILSSGGSQNQMSQGKKMITYAIIGMVLIFASWLIVNIIMTNLVSPSAIEKKVFPWPWNRIECKIPESCAPGDGNGDGDGGVTPETEKKYCICETPLYTVNKTDFPSLYDTLGTEIKGTELSNADSCTTECVRAKAGTYCFSRTLTALSSEANLYCASQNEIKAKQAFCVRKNVQNVPAEKLACFSSIGACSETITPQVAEAKKNCITNCFVDGNPNCYCTSGQDVGCTSSSPSGLRRNYKEQSVGTFLNAFSCIINCDYSGGQCRLGSSFKSMPTCGGGSTGNWCTRSAPSGSDKWILNPPPGGADSKQKGDASSALASLINCMYTREPNLRINSISSNILCSNGSCDITGYNCGHTANSCHYGGTQTQCAGYSYAVDFHTNVSCQAIKAAALACNSTAWVNWETNHVHVSVNNVACGCAESGPGNPCP